MKSILTFSSITVLFLLVGALLFAAGGFRERLLGLESRVTHLETGTISEVVVRKRPSGSELTEVRLTTDAIVEPTATPHLVAANRMQAQETATDAMRGRLDSEAIAASGQVEKPSAVVQPTVSASQTRAELTQAFSALSIRPTKSPVSFPTHGYSYLTDQKGYLFFSVGGAEFSDSAIAVLRDLANRAKEQGTAEIIISSFTDSSGAEALNTKLAEERASLVGKALKALDAPGKITLNPIGASEPRYTNETPLGRMKNRRVEVSLNNL